ncbi:hypothetical protein ES703_49550 [subsurface metagenome]
MEKDIPFHRCKNAADGHQGGGFACAIPPDKTDDLIFVHLDGYSLQRPDISVVGLDVIQFKQHRQLLCPNMPQSPSDRFERLEVLLLPAILRD